jgi:hypothetical protein
LTPCTQTKKSEKQVAKHLRPVIVIYMNNTQTTANTATHIIEFKDRAAAKAREEMGPNTIDTYRRGTSWYVVCCAEAK